MLIMEMLDDLCKEKKRELQHSGHLLTQNLSPHDTSKFLKSGHPATIILSIANLVCS